MPEMIHIPDLHDAEVVGIEVWRRSRVVLVKLQLPDESLRTVIFRRVYAFRAVDFVDQNVVSRLVIFPSNKLEDEDARILLNWVRSFGDYDASLQKDDLNEILSIIKNDNLTLVYFEPSRGAEIVVLFQTVEIS